MTCDTALDRMLEADPAELRHDAGSDLARHLAECERCGAVARTLTAELERVDAGLGAWADAGDADAAVDKVLEDRGSRIEHRASSIERGTWLRYGWVPVAAAAVVAGVLLFPRPEPDWGAVPPGPDIQPTVAVRPPEGRSAAIMNTGNPNITIVWLFEEET